MAGVVKLVYTLALGASAFGRESSSLSTCTINKKSPVYSGDFLFNNFIFRLKYSPF